MQFPRDADIYRGIGGSATNGWGIGMLQSLGYGILTRPEIRFTWRGGLKEIEKKSQMTM